MPLYERQNVLVEDIWTLPGDRVAGIWHRGPFVALEVRRPDAHQRRWRKKIGAGRHDEDRHRDGGELGEGVRRAQRLGGRPGLPGMLVDFDPALCALRIRAAI